MNQHHQAPWSDDIIASKNLEWEGDPDGRVVLLVPRFRKGILAKWLQPRMKSPFMRVKLDKIGSFIWKNIDGSKNFGNIANDMMEHFGDKCHPADERLKKFYLMLYKSQFIKLFKLDSDTKFLDK